MAGTSEDILMRFVAQNDSSGVMQQIVQDLLGMNQKLDDVSTAGLNVTQMLAGFAIAAGGVAILYGEFELLKESVFDATDVTLKYGQLSVFLGRGIGETKEVMAEWKDTVYGATEATGQLKADISSSVVTFARMGITNEEMNRRLVEGAAAMSQLTGQDLSTVSLAFGKMIESGMILNKTLSQYGLNMQDLGVTTEEFKELTQEERAAVIASAMEKKGAADINKQYADSLYGQINRIKNAWGAFQLVLGQIVLPVILPFFQSLAGAAENAVNWFKNLSPPIQSLLILIPILVGGFMLVFGSLVALNAAWPLIATGFGLITGEMASTIVTMMGLTGMAVPTAVSMEAVGAAAAHSGVGFGIMATGETAATGATIGLTQAIKMFFIGLGPIGWAIIAITTLATVLVAWAAASGVFTSGTDRMSKAMEGLKNQATTLRQREMEAGQQVTRLQDQLSKATPGTKEYADLTQRLANAQKDHRDKANEANLAEGNLANKEAQNAGILERHKNAVNDLVKAILRYKVANGEMTAAQADAIAKGVDENKMLTDAQVATLNEAKGMETLAKETNTATDKMNKMPPALRNTFPAFDGLKVKLDSILPGLQGLSGVDIKMDTPGVNAGTNALNQFLKPLYGMSPGVIPGIQWLGATGASLISFFGSTGKSAMDIFSGGLKTVNDAWFTLQSTVQSATANITSTITSNIGNAVNTLKQFLCPIIGCSPGLIPAWKELGDTIPKEVNRIMPSINKINSGMVSIPSIGIGGPTGKISGLLSRGGGGTTVHHHNENFTIDASHMTEKQLEAMLIRIFERNPAV